MKTDIVCDDEYEAQKLNVGEESCNPITKGMDADYFVIYLPCRGPNPASKFVLRIRIRSDACLQFCSTHLDHY